jgi:hypothetical protein
LIDTAARPSQVPPFHFEKIRGRVRRTPTHLPEEERIHAADKTQTGGALRGTAFIFVQEIFMSQMGTIISCAARTWWDKGIQDWTVNYSYTLDAGGTAQAQVVVGNSGPPDATVAGWTSPTSTVTVTPNPPGTTNPVLLPCPQLVQVATFGVSLNKLLPN